MIHFFIHVAEFVAGDLIFPLSKIPSLGYFYFSTNNLLIHQGRAYYIKEHLPLKLVNASFVTISSLQFFSLLIAKNVILKDKVLSG